MVSIRLPHPQLLLPRQVKLVELAFCLSPSLFAYFLTSFAISAVEDMSHFLGNLNRPPTFRTAQGSSPSAGRSPSSSILPVIASSPAATVDVPSIIVGVPAPSTDQDHGVGRQPARASSGSLNSAQILIDKGKRLAD